MFCKCWELFRSSFKAREHSFQLALLLVTADVKAHGNMIPSRTVTFTFVCVWRRLACIPLWKCTVCLRFCDYFKIDATFHSNCFFYEESSNSLRYIASRILINKWWVKFYYGEYNMKIPVKSIWKGHWNSPCSKSKLLHSEIFQGMCC